MRKHTRLILFMLGLLLSVMVGGCVASASPTDYYVSALHGSDRNSGLSPETPFRNLQFAHNRTKPGDTVHIMEGHYVHTSRGNQALLEITRSGAPDAYITYTAYQDHKPVLSAKGSWNVIL